MENIKKRIEFPGYKFLKKKKKGVIVTKRDCDFLFDFELVNFRERICVVLCLAE